MQAKAIALVVLFALLSACDSGTPRSGTSPDDASVPMVDMGIDVADAGMLDAGPLPCELDPSCEPGPEFDFSEFDAMMEAFVRERGLSGATAAIVHREHGELHLRGYGDHDADRVSLLASGSKFISATVILRQHEQGVLDINANIASYMPRGSFRVSIWPPWLIWEARWDRTLNPLFRDFTLEAAMSHRSGIPGLLSLDTVNPFTSLCSYVRGGSLGACGRQIYSNAISETPPGTIFRYGGGQWQVAGAVAEARSEKTWAELVDETFAPCGVTSLGYTNMWLEPIIESVLTGVITDVLGFLGDLFTFNLYSFVDSFDPNNPVQTDNPSIEGGAYANASDLGKIVLMHLRDGRCGNSQVLSSAMAQEMRRDRGHGGDVQLLYPWGYGMGLHVRRDVPGPVVHSVGAFGTMPFLDVARGYGGVIVLESSQLDGEAVWGRASAVLNPMFE